MSRLETDTYRALMQQEIDRLAAIGADDLALAVPHLPGWTVHSVVGHVGWLLRWVSLCLEADPETPPSRASVGEPPVGAEVLAWYQEASYLINGALDRCDLDAVHPSWTGPQPTRWWLRRLSHEVAMHRWDVDAADGSPNPIDAAQALDGVDEVLDVFAPARLRFDTLGASNQTIHLHATDIDDGEWLVHLGPDSLTWESGHAKGDVAARGTASDLLLMLWSRIGPDQLQVFGDTELLNRWQQAAIF